MLCLLKNVHYGKICSERNRKDFQFNWKAGNGDDGIARVRRIGCRICGTLGRGGEYSVLGGIYFAKSYGQE